jgi:uncharacterized membrane protein YccC
MPTIIDQGENGRRVTVVLSVRLRRILPNDPGLAGLRRATRAALVIPAAFAFAMIAFDDVQVTTFVAFGCFALMVLADFGGARRPRAAAYVITTLVGAVLVTIGTLASTAVWIAAIAMFFVGFSIRFAGVFGGYVAAAQTALLLSFVLAVSVTARPTDIGPRLSGWLLAGAVSTLAGVFLWPRFERIHLRHKAAAACRALADLIGAQRGTPPHADLSQRRGAAEAAVAAVSHEYAATQKRPAGPARRDRAFVELLTELGQALDFAIRPFRQGLSAPHPSLAESDALAARVVRVLASSADVLVGGPPPDLLGLVEARLTHRQALDRWAADALRAGRSAEEVLDGLEVDHALREVSYLTLAIGSNAVVAAGGHVDAALHLLAGMPPGEGLTGTAIRVARTIRTRLEPSSSLLHNSLRVAVGLTLAVLLSQLLRLDHAFWVVLGTLSVLRSNALGTGRTTIEALAGTVAGFAVGATFTALAGTNSGILWAALPVAVFLATYAASAIGFVAGQAAFTVLIIVLFNLIAPVGWRLGLVRVEDIAVGVGISVVTGLLLWPRGARGELRRAITALYRAVAGDLANSFDRIIEGDSPEHGDRARSRAIRTRDLAGDAFDQYLLERGAKPLNPETGAFLVAAGTHAIVVGDLVNAFAETGYRAAGCGDGVAALRTQTHVVVAAFNRLAARLDGAPGAAGPLETVSGAVLREAALACLHRWKEDPTQGRAAIAVVTAGEWIDELGAQAGDLEEPVTAAIEAARLPWWR